MGQPGPAIKTNMVTASVDVLRIAIDAILILFGADNMGIATRAVAGLSELPVRIQLLPVEMTGFMRRSRIGSCGRLRVLELLSGPSSLRDRLL